MLLEKMKRIRLYYGGETWITCNSIFYNTHVCTESSSEDLYVFCNNSTLANIIMTFCPLQSHYELLMNKKTKNKIKKIKTNDWSKLWAVNWATAIPNCIPDLNTDQFTCCGYCMCTTVCSSQLLMSTGG